ncbi:unnamed protein product [Heligmosomoides polygyrus]|uniref:Uncharacterized protein n=1 Tax=Heligmosomoides polygyrus TaxID=6339 RepID=A0A183F7E6_HELPZ|nr:unnamed protein product [Heligmosomoides polygyrus]
METKMLRWIAGVARLNHVRNDSIRQRVDIAPTSDKLREARLRYTTTSFALTTTPSTVRKIGMNNEIPGKGSGKAMLARYVALGLKDGWCAPDQEFNRENCHHHTRRADPTTKDRR